MRRAFLAFPVAALLLAGCGGSSPKAASDHTSSATPTTAATTSATPSSRPSEPAAPSPQAHTQQSAQQFARYVLQLVVAAYKNRDAASFEAIVEKNCSDCRVVAKTVRQERKQGWRQVLNKPIHVDYVLKVPDPKLTGVNLQFTTPGGRLVNDDGSVRRSFAAQPNSYFKVMLTWSGDQWRVSKFELAW